MISELNADITIKGIQEVDDLFLLIEKYKDELPEELKMALCHVAEYGIGDIDRDWIDKHYPNTNERVFECSMPELKIISTNKLLKRVYGKNRNDAYALPEYFYPKHFWSKVNGDTIVEW